MLTLDGPLPNRLGDCVDEYKAVRDIRLAMEKEVELVAVRERALKEHLILSLEKGDEKGVYGLKFKAEHRTKRIPKIKDGGWPELWQFVFESGRTDLVQKRLNDKAIMDGFEAEGALPPGVETMLVSEISVTKI